MAAKQTIAGLKSSWRFHAFVSLLCLMGIIWLSAGRSLKASYAKWRASGIIGDFVDNPENSDSFQFRRKLQQHFLDFDLYIPLEDIVVAATSSQIDDNVTFLMRNACGQAKIYVWIPYTIRLPILGSRTWEQCWTPI